MNWSVMMRKYPEIKSPKGKSPVDLDKSHPNLSRMMLSNKYLSLLEDQEKLRDDDDA